VTENEREYRLSTKKLTAIAAYNQTVSPYHYKETLTSFACLLTHLVKSI